MKLVGGIIFLLIGLGWFYISRKPAILGLLTEETHSIEMVRLVSKFAGFFSWGIALICFASLMFGFFN